MSVFNLNKIFRPEHVAIVGASDDPKSVGAAVFRNMKDSFPGEVYPVNLKRDEVNGVRAYGTVADLPQKPDLVVVCTPASTVASVVEQCGEAGIRGVIVNSAGFAELGESGKALQQEVRETTRRFEGLRVIGPNCLGVIFPRTGLNASFARHMPRDGRVAFISQSGAVCTAVLDWAEEERIGFSCFVSVGNMLDVDFGDLIDYLAADAKTEALILYIESILDARKFLSAARAFTRTKPIIAYKAGRFPESAQAAASHTGALAGADAVYDAAFERAGIVRIEESKDMFDCAELLSQKRVPRRERLAIVTNAGGPGVMATDSLMARNGRLAQLSDATMEKLNAALPKFWSHGNPVDVLGDAPPERYAEAAHTLLSDEGVDAILAVFTPQAMTDPKATAGALADFARSGAKPVLASWMGGASVREGIELLNAAGIPTYATPEQAVRAFMYLVSFATRREILYETPRDVRVDLREDRKERTAEVTSAHAATEKRFLTEMDSKAILKAYGLSVTDIAKAATASDAVAAARSLGFPVVLKLDSPDVTHKTDVGGVVLNLRDDEDVQRAFDTILADVKERRPDARVDGVTVQPMVTSAKSGYEVILGAKKDPTFGAAILVGMGGVATELYRDRAIGLPPLNERLARRMLESLRSWPLLAGYRGRPGVDVDALVGSLIRLSYLVAEMPQVKELDVNPLLVTPEGAIALDARILLDDTVADVDSAQPFAHLAIHPYPKVYEKSTELGDGTAVFLRPIRPEDEPMWLDFIDSTSRESVFQRFRQLVRRSHELASRFCFIDYDREMAIVAEMNEGGERKLVGVGRLVADPDHEVAEYAVLVADAWQGRGLGGILTDHCLELARPWGVSEIVAYTSLGNSRSLKLFRRRGFQVESRDGWGEVELRLRLEDPLRRPSSP